jgi:hypothetical protein
VTDPTSPSHLRASNRALAGDPLLEPLRAAVARAAIASVRRTLVLGDRAEVLGAVALVLRESRRYVAEPEPMAQPAT